MGTICTSVSASASCPVGLARTGRCTVPLGEIRRAAAYVFESAGGVVKSPLFVLKKHEPAPTVEAAGRLVMC
jgi:hypothetical protein